MGFNLGGQGKPLPSTHADVAARSTPAPVPRTAGLAVLRGHTWHETVTDGRPTRAPPRRQKMKAAVFAALATTAAAFAPVARPLAAAAATKLSVVPETVAELPSMLTALPTLTAPQEGELFFTSPFFIAFFVLSSTLGWPVLAALRLNSIEE